MKHILGNTPKCKDCFFYQNGRNEQIYKNRNYDGFCTNSYQCTHGANGHKLEKPRERIPVLWNECCGNWEEVEDRITYFEAVTRKPEPARKGEDLKRVIELLTERKERS